MSTFDQSSNSSISIVFRNAEVGKYQQEQPEKLKVAARESRTRLWEGGEPH